MTKHRSRLTTVDVPAPLQPLFLAAQAAVEQYFGERLEDPEHSTLSISGERYVLVRGASLSVEFFDLVASLYAGHAESREVARSLLYDLAHALGKADASAFAGRMDLTDPVARLAAGPIHFSFAGWAFVAIHPDSSPTADDDFFLHFDHPYSFEADAWRTRGRKVDTPVCVMSAGYSSGWCEESFGLELASVEVECVARGDPRCRFVMAPPGRLEGHLTRVGGRPGEAPRHPATIPEFFQRKRLEEELRASHRNLERSVAERTAELARTNAALEAELTVRRRAEQAMRESEERLRFLADNLPSGMLYELVMDPGGRGRRFTYVSGGVLQAHGVTPEEVYADPAVLYGQIDPEDTGRVAAREEEARRTLMPFAAEVRFRLPSGEVRWRLLRSAPRQLPDGSTSWHGVELDVTDQRRAEAERAQLEERLRHHQRMESIGQLAGGVAHDFNNLLTAIAGNVAMALQELPPGGDLHEGLADAARAAESAAHLTRQLLAFSRKQAIDPRVLDLDATVGGLQKMLGRLLREDVTLRIVPSGGPALVRADPGQIEQILVNLVVNARDALPDGGTITVRTGIVTLDGSPGGPHPDAPPGEYVVLSVADEGVGMSDEVKAHLFEPFFTTKPPGKGTGLGLATVYGAVRQAGGAVEVRSAPGAGTTVVVLFPRVGERGAEPDAPPRPEEPQGSETILLVEDNDVVRAFARRVLQRKGYRVIDHPDGASALAAPDEPAQLLVTDVVMPGMNGRVLAERLRERRPGLRVLFTSGYTQDAFANEALAPLSDFLPKPYSPEELRRRVRALLDQG